MDTLTVGNATRGSQNRWHLNIGAQNLPVDAVFYGTSAEDVQAKAQRYISGGSGDTAKLQTELDLAIADRDAIKADLHALAKKAIAENEVLKERIAALEAKASPADLPEAVIRAPKPTKPKKNKS